jgi:AbrB family looped-hinge helix DNA binding protein
MASKSTSKSEPVGRVGQRRQVVIPRDIFEQLRLHEGDSVAFARTDNGVIVKPKRMVDPDDMLTPTESALVKKAEREIREGKYVTLDKLRHDLDRPRPRRRGKTA